MKIATSTPKAGSASAGGLRSSTGRATFGAQGVNGSDRPLGSAGNLTSSMGTINVDPSIIAGNLDSEALRARNQMLEADLERRQKTYIERERAYKTRIEDLEEELKSAHMLKTGYVHSLTKYFLRALMHTQLGG